MGGRRSSDHDWPAWIFGFAYLAALILIARWAVGA